MYEVTSQDRRLNLKEKLQLTKNTRETITNLNDVVDNYVCTMMGAGDYDFVKSLSGKPDKIAEDDVLAAKKTITFIENLEDVWQRLSILYAESIGVEHPMQLWVDEDQVVIRRYDTIDPTFLSFHSSQPPEGMTFEEETVGFSRYGAKLNHQRVRTNQQRSDVEALLRPLVGIIAQLEEEAGVYWGQQEPLPAPEYADEALGTRRRILAAARRRLKKSH